MVNSDTVLTDDQEAMFAQFWAAVEGGTERTMLVIHRRKRAKIVKRLNRMVDHSEYVVVPYLELGSKKYQQKMESRRIAIVVWG